jgi:hypothetical protein
VDVMEKPERSELDLFGPDNLAKQKALAKAYRKGGKPALSEALAEMYPDLAGDPKSAKPPAVPNSTSSADTAGQPSQPPKN